MNACDLIRKKRDGERLSEKEIRFLVDGFALGKIPDYQMSSFLMSVYFQGMNDKETYNLVHSMMDSGEIIDLQDINTYKVDKHSTGGVGDKISIILAPLVASCGLTVPMISGRGLGHTGGTLDKLESIPGFKTSMDTGEFRKILKQTGVAIVGQTKRLVPADRKMYALRDVTATVESIPLITASILSKKLASGIDGLVMDVKVGKGAFMKNLKDAKILANLIKKVTKISKKDIVCLLTDMNQPLGNSIGNSIEIEECIDVLNGKGPEDIRSLTLQTAAWMLKMGGIKDINQAFRLASKNLANKEALKKFKTMVKMQGGDSLIFENPGVMKKAKFKKEILCNKSGFVESIDPMTLGLSLVRLGAGREKVEDKVDHSVGIRLYKKVADKVSKGEPLLSVYFSSKSKFAQEEEIIVKSVKISKNKVKPQKLVLATIS